MEQKRSELSWAQILQGPWHPPGCTYLLSSLTQGPWKAPVTLKREGERKTERGLVVGLERQTPDKGSQTPTTPSKTTTSDLEGTLISLSSSLP